MRKLLSDGRHSNPNGTVEEKFLHYFFAHQESERVGREHIRANAELLKENEKLRSAAAGL